MSQRCWFLFLLPSFIFAQGSIIEGTVVNGITGSALSNVGVVVWQRNGPHYEGATDTAGRFHLEEITPGAYSARFDKDGFVSLELYSDESFSIGPGKQPPPARVKLLPFARVRGRVYTPEGAPSGNESVTPRR